MENEINELTKKKTKQMKQLSKNGRDYNEDDDNNLLEKKSLSYGVGLMANIANTINGYCLDEKKNLDCENRFW